MKKSQPDISWLNFSSVILLCIFKLEIGRENRKVHIFKYNNEFHNYLLSLTWNIKKKY